MFKDLNSDNNDKKITVKSSKSKIIKISDKIHKISNDETDVAAMFLMSDDKTAFVNLSGSAKYIKKAMLTAAQEDPDFKTLILQTAIELSPGFSAAAGMEDIDKLDDKVKKEVREKGMSGFVLPDGKKGIAIDADEIDNLTEEQMDDIIEQMMKGKGIDPYDPEGEGDGSK